MTTRPGDNPFSSRRIDSLEYRFTGGDIDRLLAELARRNHRGAIVGPHGSGKTTLLDALARRLGGRVLRVDLRSTAGRPVELALAALPDELDGSAVLVDGAEQLGPLGWWRLAHRCRRAPALVITSHRSGRLPTLHRCTTDPDLLAELVRELSPETAEAVDLDALFHRNHGDIRRCFRELYDLRAGRSA